MVKWNTDTAQPANWSSVKADDHLSWLSTTFACITIFHRHLRHPHEDVGVPCRLHHHLECFRNDLTDVTGGVQPNGAHEADRDTLDTESASTTDAVKVAVSVGSQVVVDGKVDALDVDTTAEDVVGGTTDALLELLVALDATRDCERDGPEVESGDLRIAI